MQNLPELIPELRDGWELRRNGGYFKQTDYNWFEMYFLPAEEKSDKDNSLVEIGFYSKSPFKSTKDLKRKFKWYMKEFNIDLPVKCVERTDGWYMFVTATNGFKYFYSVLNAVGSED